MDLIDHHLDRIDLRFKVNVVLTITAIVFAILGAILGPFIGIEAKGGGVLLSAVSVCVAGVLLVRMHPDKRQAKTIFLMTAALVLGVGALVMPAPLAWMLIFIAIASLLVATSIGNPARTNAWNTVIEFLASVPVFGAIVGWHSVNPSRRVDFN